MPLYEYQCATHGLFESFGKIEGRNIPVPCPCCGTLSEKAMSLPALAVMSPLNRMAAERNDRSRHEPRLTSGRVPSRCGHHHHATGTNHQTGAEHKPKRQSYRGARPWVIEHQ